MGKAAILVSADIRTLLSDTAAGRALFRNAYAVGHRAAVGSIGAVRVALLVHATVIWTGYAVTLGSHDAAVGVERRRLEVTHLAGHVAGVAAVVGFVGCVAAAVLDEAAVDVSFGVRVTHPAYSIAGVAAHVPRFGRICLFTF